jgi:DNA-binding NarL/FixJ family response regulator
MPALKLLIVDDNPQVRLDLSTLLGLLAPAAGLPLEIAGAAPDGQSAIRLAQQFLPDVILMDLEMPLLDGFSAVQQIKSLHPSIYAVALTIHDYEAVRLHAAQAGFDAFIVKGEPVDRILQILSSIYQRVIINEDFRSFNSFGSLDNPKR